MPSSSVAPRAFGEVQSCHQASLKHGAIAVASLSLVAWRQPRGLLGSCPEPSLLEEPAGLACLSRKV